MLALQVFDENKKPIRLFACSGNVRSISQKYYEKFPAEKNLLRHVAYRRHVCGVIQYGPILEMDQPEE